MTEPTKCRCHPAVDDSGHCLPRQPVACIYCGHEHDNGTACPPLEFPGTEWDQ